MVVHAADVGHGAEVIRQNLGKLGARVIQPDDAGVNCLLIAGGLHRQMQQYLLALGMGAVCKFPGKRRMGQEGHGHRARQLQGLQAQATLVPQIVDDDGQFAMGSRAQVLRRGAGRITQPHHRQGEDKQRSRKRWPALGQLDHGALLCMIGR